MHPVNENRPGYKHTPLGWIPEEWEVTELNSVAEIQQGVSKGKQIQDSNAVELPYMRVANIKDGYLDLSEVKYIRVDKSDYVRFLLRKDDILITEGGDPDKLGRGAKWNEEVKNCIYQNHLFRIRALNGTLSSDYFYYYLQGKRAKTYFLNCAKQTTGIASVNSTQVKEMPVIIASSSEQRRIATILSTWNKAIATTQQLITQLQQLNKGLMLHLLTGKKRLKGFAKEWKEIHLGDIFMERNETGHIDLNLLSVGSLGIYLQSQSEKRDTSNIDKTKYKRICPGDIGYNTMRMWQGRSALSSIEGIVSPAYTIITPKENADPVYFAFLLKFPPVVHRFFRNSQGLVEDTLNCKFKDFSLVKVSIPEYHEQVAIAAILTKANEQIKMSENHLSSLQQQKKGLMQKLLTGEIRVRI